MDDETPNYGAIIVEKTHPDLELILARFDELAAFLKKQGATNNLEAKMEEKIPIRVQHRPRRAAERTGLVHRGHTANALQNPQRNHFRPKLPP